jgi:hypothetical protein
MEIYDWKQTSHSHGSSPKVEDLDFYLSYHAMMITADKLLQTRPLLESEYSSRSLMIGLNDMIYLSRTLLVK